MRYNFLKTVAWADVIHNNITDNSILDHEMFICWALRIAILISKNGDHTFLRVLYSTKFELGICWWSLMPL